MKTFVVGMALALALAADAGATGAPGSLEGRWITQTGNVEIVFAPCGSVLCGSVSRVMGNVSMSGPGVSAAAPPEIGMKIVTDLRPTAPGKWKGRLFDREKHRTYDCVVEPMGAKMVVRPYVMLPVFGKALTWTRAAS